MVQTYNILVPWPDTYYDVRTQYDDGCNGNVDSDGNIDYSDNDNGWKRLGWYNDNSDDDIDDSDNDDGR
jgi:hypothetical protein